MKGCAVTDTADNAPLPYTYFRAGGWALDRIEAATAAGRDIEKLRRDLCKRYGANEVMYSVHPDTGHILIRDFYFAPVFEKNVPAHWQQQRQTGSDGVLHAVFAHPPAGSPDAFFLADYGGLMQRADRRRRLEHMLGAGEMPMRDLPAGRYPSAFVRDRMEENQGPTARRIGHIRENVARVLGSNTACRGGDPLDAMEMMGQWYLRVPNDENGQPRFTPPDSIPVPLEEMMRIDREEMGARSDRARAAAFDPGI